MSREGTMGFFYRKNGENTTVGYRFTIKFGGKNHDKEDEVNKWPSRILDLLNKLGVSVESESDNDPNKDKHIL